MILDRPEQRRAARRRQRRRVHLEPGAVPALTEDVSLDGAFILTSQWKPPGTRVQLRFSSAERQVLAEGLVRWVRRSPNLLEGSEPVGMGIEFVGPQRGLEG